MGETNTLISLREYVDIRFEAQEKSVNAALTASDRAVNKAEAASEKRFDAVNEFRAALADNARLMMPRAESEQANKVLSSKIETLEGRVNSWKDRSGGNDEAWGRLGLILSLLVNVALVIFTAVTVLRGHG
jgi:hypothetical protein